jgi:hypothetical protein
MLSYIKYLNPFYYFKSDDTMLCVNSFANTDKRFNYIIERSEPDEDKELDIEDYLDPINK